MFWTLTTSKNSNIWSLCGSVFDIPTTFQPLFLCLPDCVYLKIIYGSNLRPRIKVPFLWKEIARCLGDPPIWNCLKQNLELEVSGPNRLFTTLCLDFKAIWNLVYFWFTWRHSPMESQLILILVSYISPSLCEPWAEFLSHQPTSPSKWKIKFLRICKWQKWLPCSLPVWVPIFPFSGWVGSKNLRDH